MTTSAAIVQARMGSKRFPGKVLRMLGERTVLDHVAARCDASLVDRTIIATSALPIDDPIAAWALRRKLLFYRGSMSDVADRICSAATYYRVDLIVRVNADCPRIDPNAINTLLDEWEPGIDYLSYSVCGKPAVMTHAGLPELVTTAALKRLTRYTSQCQEHVTWGAHQTCPIVSKWIEADEAGDRNWTLDTPEDLARLEKMCAART